MPGDKERIKTDERAAIRAIGDDAMKLFRAGLFLIVIYISILSLTLRTGGTEYIKNIINSLYTIIGIIFWFGSVTVSILTHRVTRRISLQEHYSQLGRIDDKFDVLNLSTAGTLGLLISVFSLIFGLLEGWGNTVNESTIGIGIEQPLGIIGLSFIFVLWIYVTLSMLDLVRSKWGPIRKILRLS